MKHLTNAQTRALHRVIEMAETWARASAIAGAGKANNGIAVMAWEATLRDAKSAMQQVHIQQVYLKKQEDLVGKGTPAPIASGGRNAP